MFFGIYLSLSLVEAKAANWYEERNSVTQIFAMLQVTVNNARLSPESQPALSRRYIPFLMYPTEPQLNLR